MVSKWIETGEMPAGWKMTRVDWRNPDTKKGKTRTWRYPDGGQTPAQMESARETLAAILRGQFK